MRNRELKDSAIPWIGDIPKDWTVCFIKQIMRNKSIKGYPDEMVLSLYRDYGVVPKDSRDDNHNVTSEDTSSYKFVEVGDFVINKMKAWQGSMAVSDYQGIISPAYYICRFITNEIDRKYIHYLLRNDTYKAEYMRLSSGMRVGQWDLNIDDFLRIKMVLPSLSEQQKIASFLDRKCSEIDEMIALQEQIIEELKAYKQSVITEAVTKGLNPDVPMKDSGIEWIGEIPEHWEVHRIKNHFSIISGSGFDVNLQGCTDGDLPVCKASDISKANQFVYRAENYLSREVALSQKFNIIPQNSIVFPKIGEAMRKNRRAITAVECCVDNNCQALVPSRISAIYSYYLLCCINMEWFDNAGTIPSINNQKLKDARLPYPLFNEQKAIAEYLDTKCTEIDNLISIKLSKIDSLKEYKKSIIYEYVTGKKEVND